MTTKFHSPKPLARILPGQQPSDWMVDMERKYKKINLRIKRVCQKSQNKFHGSALPRRTLQKSILDAYKKSLYDREHHLAYCRQAKAC